MYQISISVSNANIIKYNTLSKEYSYKFNYKNGFVNAKRNNKGYAVYYIYKK